MKVVILAGGFGTRFGTQTEYVPKPMIRIGSHPMLWHIMKSYMSYGYTDFVLCLGYKGDMIKEYFLNYPYYNNDFTMNFNGQGQISVTPHIKNQSDNIQVTLVSTGLRSQTGSRISQIREYIGDDDFMVTYGDGVADINIKELVDFHKSHKKIATLSGVYSPGRFGNLKMSGNQITKFEEKSHLKDNLINGGFYVFRKEIFDYLEDDQNCILEKDPLERLSQEGELMCYSHLKFWQCMDTLRDLEHLNKLWSDREAPWKVWKD